MICKYCNSGSLIKKGKVKTKFSEKQIYLCKDCGKKFVETSIPNKTYSARIIYDTVSNYNLHNTMKRAVALTNKIVYILDYKPNAKQDRKASGQLYLYAQALSLRLNMKLEDFRCAWFDEENYFEFNPSLSVRKFEKTIIPNLIGL